jgi:hypothetical protein
MAMAMAMVYAKEKQKVSLTIKDRRDKQHLHHGRLQDTSDISQSA